MVAYNHNPSYLGGRDQEDCSLRPAPAKSLKNLISTTKRLGMVVGGRDLLFQLHGKCK
jgi:hypothetical protein